MRSAPIDLIDAANHGALEEVQRAIDEGADVHAVAPDGGTALHYAALRGHQHIAECLVAAGAAVDQRDNDGDTPLTWAALEGQTGLVDWLLNHGASLEGSRAKGSALHVAAEQGHAETAMRLLEAGADPDERDAMGCTPLRYAIMEGHVAVGEVLVSFNADLDAPVSEGKTELHLASMGNAGLVDWLLRHGADPNVKDKQGLTPLAWATMTGQAKAVTLLTEHDGTD